MPESAQNRNERQEGLRSLLSRARRLAADFATLAVLDARHAARHLVEILCVVVVSAILVTTAWLALVVVVVGWMVGSGASWFVSLLLAAVLNLVMALLFGLWVRRRLRESPFAALLRQLRGEPAPGASS